MLGFLRRKDKTQEGLKKSRETWFGRLASVFRGPRLEDAVWAEAEEVLLGADAGFATTQELLTRTREQVQREQVRDPQRALELLKEEMLSLLRQPDHGPQMVGDGPLPKPLVVLVVGVNGVGKTTSIAKLSHYLKSEGKRVLLGAADTFRAAAIEQLQVWAERVDVEVVAHRTGGDAGAVAYDAFEAARARGADVVLIDTAGRLHTKRNLMEELRKVRRVLSRLDPQAPHQVLLVLDATVGQNGLAQARAFTEGVGCTGIFLAKLDGTAKGGIVLAICDQLKLPILFIGTGEGIEDLAPFSPEEFVEALFATAPEGPRPGFHG